MDRQLRTLRIIHAAMVAAAILYVALAEFVLHRSDKKIGTAAYSMVAILAAVVASAVFKVRDQFLRQPSEILRMQPDDIGALGRWRVGYVLLLSMAEAIVLYGLLARFMGASWQGAAPFYVMGIALLFAFYPRRPS